MIMGISGGAGSGKTTVAPKIISLVRRDNAGSPHPDELATELLINHLEALRANEPIDQPIYDYATHSRKAETHHVEPRPVIIMEGILVFVNSQMRGLMDLKIFVDTDADIRFIRRLDRDVHERGRTLESVITQYTTTVRPMHLQFVEPSKRYADIIIPEGGFNDVGIDLITGKVKSFLARAIDQDRMPVGTDANEGERTELPS